MDEKEAEARPVMGTIFLVYVTGSEKRGHFGANFFSIFLAKHEVYLISFNMNYNLPFKSL